MKKVLPIILLVLAAVVMLPVMIGGATWLAYRDNRMKCDPPVPTSHLDELGVAIPADAKVCRETSNPSGGSFNLVVASPSFFCLATFQAVGCTSLTKAGLSFIGPMTDAGWGTGSNKAGSDDSASFEFERGHDRAHLSLSKSRYGEVTASFQVSSVGKGKKGKQAKAADDE